MLKVDELICIASRQAAGAFLGFWVSVGCLIPLGWIGSRLAFLGVWVTSSLDGFFLEC